MLDGRTRNGLYARARHQLVRSGGDDSISGVNPAHDLDTPALTQSDLDRDLLGEIALR
jgi:hypothetical protein